MSALPSAIPSYVSGVSATPLIGRTIGQALEAAAARWGDTEAIVSRHQRQRLTYARLLAESERAARGFLALGVAKGDRVAIWSPNRTEWLLAQYGLALVGAIAVNVNPAFKRDELAYVLGHSGCVGIVAAPSFRGHDYLQTVAGLRGELPSLKHVIALADSTGDGALAWPGFLRGGDAVAPERLREAAARAGFDDPVSLQYTSGTTGRPKGASLSHHNILNNGYFVVQRQQLGAGDRLCLPVPFFHCFGIVLGAMGALTHGVTLVLPGESFEPRTVLDTVQAERCTALYGVPMMFIAMLAHEEFDAFDLSTLRAGAMGGAPCPSAVMRQAIERMHMRGVTVVYGMTETSPISFQSLPDDDLERRVGTIGAVHPHVECKIVDPASGEVVPRGTAGELCTRGYSVMLGYWDDPAATAKAIDAARWMHTGDLGVMREDGYVVLVGRSKDTIIRGGENVYPREVEEFIHTLPKVADVQVVGVPDARYGEEVCAWVRLKPGERWTPEELREACRGRIASYKIPRYVKFVDEYPSTASGKVQKFRMREQAIVELGLSTDAPAAAQ